MAGNYNRESKLDKFRKVLFADPDAPGMQLTENEQKELNTYRSLFTYISSNPWEPDSNLINWIRTDHKDKYGELCTKAVAMGTLAFVKSLLGNIKVPVKQFQLYQVQQMLLKQYNDPQATIAERIQAAAQLGKIYRLDKPDEEQIPWDTITAKIEITLLPGDVGLPVIDNVKELQDKLRRKYLEAFTEDAVVIESSTKKTEE